MYIDIFVCVLALVKHTQMRKSFKNSNYFKSKNKNRRLHKNLYISHFLAKTHNYVPIKQQQ